MPLLLRSLVVRGSCLSGLLLAGCTAPESTPVEAAPRPQPMAEAKVEVKAEAKVEAKAEAKAEAPAEAPAKAEPAAPAVTWETKVGVAACDDYVARYRACVEQMVAANEKQAHSRAALGQLATWVAAKADPKLAPAIEAECAAAAEAARATTRVLGCVWREGDSPTPELPRGGKPKPRSIDRGLLDFE